MQFRALTLAACLSAATLGGCGAVPSQAAESVVALPAPAIDVKTTATRATAVLAGGCFWGVEGVFAHVKGVISVESGYHGGAKSSASYDAIGSGATGHAEAVRIVYNPQEVSYGTLLRVLFSTIADPTLKNRQGPDRGTQYRAAIVPMTAAQAETARAYLAQIGTGSYFAAPIVVPVERYKAFYPAEAYHQDFMRRNPSHGYIRQWDAPKLAAFRRLYPTLWRATPAP